jgi:lysophospholipase L1-like esterase
MLQNFVQILCTGWRLWNRGMIRGMDGGNTPAFRRASAALLCLGLQTAGAAEAGQVDSCPTRQLLGAPRTVEFDRTAMSPTPPALSPAVQAQALENLSKALDSQARSDWPDLCRYRAADHALAASGAKVGVVMLGDSITEFWGIADPALFAAQTGGPTLLNRGIAGQVTPQLLLRFRQDVIDLHPLAVHLLAGTNDIMGLGGAVTLAAIEGNISSMVELADAHGIAVVLGAVPPMGEPNNSPQHAAAITALNNWLRLYAQRHVVGFADYHAALVDRHGHLDPALSIDPLHPNRAGYERMRSVLLAALKRAVR